MKDGLIFGMILGALLIAAVFAAFLIGEEYGGISSLIHDVRSAFFEPLIETPFDTE